MASRLSRTVTVKANLRPPPHAEAARILAKIEAELAKLRQLLRPPRSRRFLVKVVYNGGKRPLDAERVLGKHAKRGGKGR